MSERGGSTSEAHVARLRALDPFAAVPEPTLEQLASTLVRLGFQPGAVILREGDAGGYVYLIADGEVELVSRARVTGVLGPGQSFGGEALLGKIPQPATARARTAVTLHALDGLAFVEAVLAPQRD
jgi:CRP-like cAMP-binding protein